MRRFGICGVNIKDGKPDAAPIVPDDWDYFKLSHLYICGKEYSIEYNKETGIKTIVTENNMYVFGNINYNTMEELLCALL